MNFRKSIISIILIFALALSMMSGIGLAYAASPSDSLSSGDIMLSVEQCDLDCCSTDTNTDVLGEAENPYYPSEDDSPYLDIETLPIIPDDEDYRDDDENYNEDDDEYFEECEELELLDLDLIEQFVARLYVYVLGRPYEEQGLQNWSNALREGRSNGARVAYGFFFSDEFRRMNLSDEEFVYRLYRAILDRAPDANGNAFWISRLQAGQPRVDVFGGFVNSPEFTRLAAMYGIERGTHVIPPGREVRSFVNRMYLLALQRKPDTLGLNNWSNLLLTGRATGASIAYHFIFSEEMFIRNLSDEDFVEILYYTLLGRSPDQSGFDHWVNSLQNATSRFNVFIGFVYSPEFDRICREHGIERGSVPRPHNRMYGDTIVARIWNIMVQQNFEGISDRPEHIAGIIGNMQSEAGRNLCPFQQEIGGSRAGLGLMQWSHGRRTHLESFMWRNGVLQADFTREMNRHINSICSGTCMHPPELLNRVLQLQVQFMFYELTNTFERQYMSFIDFPMNRTGVAGARAYAELFCAIALRPSPGRAGGLDDIQDVGVIEARRASAFGGAGNLDRISFSGLAARRNNAEQIFRQFQAGHR